MSERQVLNLSDWDNLSSDELGYTGPQLSTETHRYESDNGQAFNVFVADARTSEDDPTILTSTSHDYRLDPLLKRRLSVAATQSNSRIVLSEIPGVTMDPEDPFHTKGGWQTPYQTLMAFTGNYDPLAEAQLEAMDSVIDFQPGQEIQLAGESLGAYAVVSMARVLGQRRFKKQLTISRLDLMEPVNAYGNYMLLRQARMLYSLATREDQLRQVYLGENAAIGHGDIGAFEKLSDRTKKIDRHVKVRQIPAVYLTGAGLRKGLHTALKDALADRTNDGTRLHEADITIARGIASSVSHEKDLVSAREFIREVGSDAKIISFEAEPDDETLISHHVLNSLGRFASYMTLRNNNFSQ